MLQRYRVIAVVGLSRDERKYSHTVSKFMRDEGYRIVPINPIADELLGQRVYRDLKAIPEKVDIVDVFRPSEEALDITKQAVEIGAKVVWLQEGIVSDDAKKYAESNGLDFVQDKCIMKEYIRWREGETGGLEAR